MENVSQAFVEKIIEFNNFLNVKGASLHICYPAFPKGLYYKNLKAINSIEKAIITTSSISVIGKPYDFVFEDSLFFEYPMHLNKKVGQLELIFLNEIFRAN